VDLHTALAAEAHPSEEQLNVQRVHTFRAETRIILVIYLLNLSVYTLLLNSVTLRELRSKVQGPGIDLRTLFPLCCLLQYWQPRKYNHLTTRECAE
jgi:hypothetical protein